MSDFDDDRPGDQTDGPDGPVTAPAPGPSDRTAGSAKGGGASKAAPPRPADDDWDDDWDDDDDRGPGSGRRDLTLILGIVAAVAIIALVVVLTRPKDKTDSTTNTNTGSTPAGATTTPPNKNWQGPVAEGIGAKAEDVQARIAKEPGLFIWTDFEGWHLRNKTEAAVTVTVSAESVVEKGASAKGDPSTSATVEVPTGDGTTGVDLDLGASTTATFTVKGADSVLAASEIKLGGKSGAADENPVTFTKA